MSWWSWRKLFSTKNKKGVPHEVAAAMDMYDPLAVDEDVCIFGPRSEDEEISRLAWELMNELGFEWTTQLKGDFGRHPERSIEYYKKMEKIKFEQIRNVLELYLKGRIKPGRLWGAKEE